VNGFAVSEHARAIDITSLRSRWVGIYFLLSNGEIVYVGQSTDVDSRIAGHVSATKKNKKEFDSAFWIEVPEHDLGPYEGAFIRALAPRYNWTAPKDVARDAEILALYGMAPDANALAIFFARQKDCFSVSGETRQARQREREERRQRFHERQEAIRLAGVARRETRRAPVERSRQQSRRDRLFANLTALIAARQAAS